MTAPAAAMPPPRSDDRGDRPVGVAFSVAYLPELESLRGIAAVMVMAFHYERRAILTPLPLGGTMALSLSLFGRGPMFLAGIAAAALFRRYGADWRRRAGGMAWLRAGGADVLLLALLVALAFYLRWMVFLGPGRFHSPPDHVWHALGGLLWAAVVLLILLTPLRLKPLLHNRWLTRLGVLSCTSPSSTTSTEGSSSSASVDWSGMRTPAWC